jgi:D-glycero-alpha-D-manno-heptose-7-phosphate kinase
MILTRSPLRISIAGGGTDLPAYYENFGSYFISAAINKYVYVSAHIPFESSYLLKYSNFESCKSIDEIRHPLIRETLKFFPATFPYVEIASMADIPSGTGLGSSGSFTTALIKALATLRNEKLSNEEIAALACKIEIEILGESVGKQDQYIASYGGLTEFKIDKAGLVIPSPFGLNTDFQQELESSLYLFYTGKSRSASKILMREDLKLREHDRKLVDILHFIQDMAFKIADSLRNNDLEKFGNLMSEHWRRKIERNPDVTYPEINYAYNKGMSSGALGGKLVGAGGGGFLLFVTRKPMELRLAMIECGLTEVEFQFDLDGTKRIT